MAAPYWLKTLHNKVSTCYVAAFISGADKQNDIAVP